MKNYSETDFLESFEPISLRSDLAGAEQNPDWNMLDDQLGEDQRWSTWPSTEKLMRGPLPYPEFVIEDAAAIDTELGVLKTGKEADVFLIERATDSQSSLLAAKRYRSPDQKMFRRSSTYTEGRSVRRSRDARALKNASSYGKIIEASRWADSEWQYLRLCFTAGVPVPYPVQIMGTEILMEFIEDPETPGAAAPRLQQVHPGEERLRSYWDQLVEAMRTLARLGFAHGDLSPYNVLAAGDRLVIIDLPQFVDLAGNERGVDLLQRDCQNMCTWFASRGLEVDSDELLAELIAAAW
ncbi:serine protein kinase RIO [Paeniglutamicibacter sp. R2-26]|uniref:serine protein kinase RIO n=1 Tax=Paeniglutamicibacter sp. R2-26 TaxID=3144417 RepID=UPI003EE4D9F2